MDIGVLIRAAKVMKERQAVAAWPSGAGDHLVTEEFPFAAVEEALQQRTAPQESSQPGMPLASGTGCAEARAAGVAGAIGVCRQRAAYWEAKAATVDRRLAAHRAYQLRADEAQACAEAIEKE